MSAGDPAVKDRISFRSDLILILILTLLPALFFWRLITPNLPDQMQIKSGDFTEQYFPLRAFTAQEWVNGRLPLWNPYLYGGQPALADIQSGALYPPHIAEALLLGWGAPLLFGQDIGFPLWALEAQVIAHFSLAAVGTFLFARHLGRQGGASRRRSRFMGFIAALSFTYSGYLTGFPVQQLTILEVSAWLPWVLWGVSVAQIKYRTFGLIQALRPMAGGALAFTMAILAGHPQTVLYIFYLSLAYALFLGLTLFYKTQQAKKLVSYLRPTLQSFLLWLGMIILGSMLAAPQILPTLEFIDLSLRDDLAYEAVSAGLPLNELIAILYPGFFGGSPEYVGIVSLVLGIIACALAWPRRYNPMPHLILSVQPFILFWAGLALFTLLLAFGGNTFLYPIFYLLAPGFEAVRQQERVFLVYSFSLALLAGYGTLMIAGPLPKSVRQVYDALQRRLRQVGLVALSLTAVFIFGSTMSSARGDEVNLFFGVLRHHIFGLIIFAGIFVLFVLRNHRNISRSWWMAGLAIWLIFNLFTVNWRFNLEDPSDTPPFSSTALTQFLKTQLDTAPAGQSTYRIVSGGLLPDGNSAASVYQFRDLTGNTPLQLAAVDDFVARMPAWRLWQLMHVRYILADRDISDPGLSQIFQEGDLRLFEMGDPFPKAWFVSNIEIIPNPQVAIAHLASDQFDLRQSATIAEAIDQPLDDVINGEINVVGFTPTSIQVEVSTSGQSLLVFSQIYYPGWRAEIDGQFVKIQQANGILQGVVVPEGQHIIDLSFVPTTFWNGVWIAATGLLLLVVTLVFPKLGLVAESQVR